MNDYDCRVATYSKGKGPLILMVHGLLHSNQIWEKINQNLSRDHRTLGIDLPGFGMSKPLPHQMINIRTYSNLLYNVIKSISKDSEVKFIIADSLGAVLILSLLLENTIQCRHLFLSGCPAYGLSNSINKLGDINILASSLKFLRRLPLSISKNLIKLSSKITFHKTKYVNSSLIRSVLASDPDTSELLLRELSKFRYDPEKVPNYNFSVIRGEHDRIISEESSKKLAVKLGCEYLKVPRAGHTPMIENPSYFTKIITNKLS